jgi:cation diffusion facilitator family transporter
MAVECCDSKTGELVRLRTRHARVLKIVLVVNATMFVVEFVAGVLTRSTSLLADSLDMLGDAAVYVFSLYVLGRGRLWEARASMFKGALMATFGIAVAAEAASKLFVPVVPSAAGMGAVGAVALMANMTCLLLLLRHRADDLNMKSTWLCSRNDVIANVGVLAAAAGVAVTGCRWPDLVVGSVIAALFLTSATSVLRDAIAGIRKERSAS